MGSYTHFSQKTEEGRVTVSQFPQMALPHFPVLVLNSMNLVLILIQIQENQHEIKFLKSCPMKTNSIITGLFMSFFFMMITPVILAQKSGDSIRSLQDTSAYVVLKFFDGASYTGKIRENKNDTITLISNDIGIIRVPYKKIKSADYAIIKDGKYWFTSPLPGRYLLGPSAFMLKPGEGYYQNTWVAFNSFNVGITNNISIGGGIEFFTTIVSLTQGDFHPTFFLTPKIGFKVAKDFRVGAGVLYLNVLGGEVSLTTCYGIATYGNTDYNITGGVGWGYGETSGSEGSWQKTPMITISGTARMSRKVAFVSENWFVPEGENGGGYYPIYSYGLRFLGETMCVDLAFINNRDIAKNLFIGIPWVSFTVNF